MSENSSEAISPPAPSALQVALDTRVAIGRLIRRLREVSDGQELSAAQASVLARVGKGEASSASALAALEGVRPQSMAVTISALEDLGLVSRTQDPTDRRRQLVVLTDAGRDAEMGNRDARHEWLARTIEEALTEQELDVLHRAAEIIENLARR
ncbi:MarR family winged helix-turn-helix transcriptional regulator [Gordonia hankookensis]|uniref:MarR family transcriptional regulator n=1 Tax=Gordonia hankookensis TaxID=589403 RepID=A0ABR7WH33_9ACTN|nr:MarR family transcriptional regulator [Gordonia hankookensis]MBD1322088.1 MarR family transcriptional regulator [Gordonia hankookensis]